jgi:hypothetical protein
MNSDTQLKIDLEQLAAAIARHTARRIPLAVDLWSVAEIADYLKCSERHVIEHYASRPDFPNAIRLPSASGIRRGHPRYRAQDVMAWVSKWETAK